MIRSGARSLYPTASHTLTVAIALALVIPATVHAQQVESPAGKHAQTMQRVVVKANALENAGINVRGLSQRAIFKSALGDKVLDRQQIAAAGPVGGSAQALTYAPGVAVSSYGATGSTKYQISINGI